MSRPKKATVDYFPHSVAHGKTMFILESKWGNDGYAVWFKILERLGDSDHHFIDCRDYATMAHLAAYCRVSMDTLGDILDELSAVNAIHPALWRKKLIYCQNFVDNVADAYRKRQEKASSLSYVIKVSGVDIDGINDAVEGNPAEDCPTSDGYPAEETHKGKGKGKGKDISPLSLKEFSLFWEAWPNKVDKKEAEERWSKMNGTRPAIETLLAAIKKQIEWRKAAGPNDFRPPWKNPATWLNGRCWEDEVETPKKAATW